MINIVKNTNSVVIESTIKIFPFEDGKIILPINSVTYQLGDSNYISFKNVNDNKTIFAGNINDIQVNGQAITPDDAITQLDSVLNGATGGGGGGTSDYTQLSNKPQINGVELTGNKTLDSLGIQAKGEYVTKDVNDLDNYTNNTTLEATYKKISSEWFGTQQEYDAIDPKDPNVTYYIYEN